MTLELTISDTPEQLAEAAASTFLREAGAAIHARGLCLVALSGGTTPIGMHRQLAAWRDRLDWSRVHVFWGDERFVPHDHPGSNYRMARETLLDLVPIPPESIHPVPADAASAEEAARAYERDLRACGARLGRTPPGIDLAVQGMGDDGHTASIFPGSEALRPGERLVMAVEGPPPYRARVTLTLPAINACACVMFVVQGAAKASLVRRLVGGSGDPRFPAALVRPASGCLIWCVDRAAHGDARS